MFDDNGFDWFGFLLIAAIQILCLLSVTMLFIVMLKGMMIPLPLR